MQFDHQPKGNVEIVRPAGMIADNMSSHQEIDLLLNFVG